MAWHRCPLAVLRDEPHAAAWAGWGARHFAAARAGAVSPWEQERRYSAVAFEVFGLFAKASQDEQREGQDGNQGHSPG